MAVDPFGMGEAEARAKGTTDDTGLNDHFSPYSKGWVSTPVPGQPGIWTRDAGTTWEQQADAWNTDPAHRPDGAATGGAERNSYMYGREAGGADAAANLALQTGTGAQAYGMSTDAADRYIAGQVQNRQGPQGDWANQNNALAAARFRGNQLAGLEAQQGPSAAQAQLQSGTNQAMASQLAMARSGRGMGGNAASMGLAQGNMAGIQANQTNQAGMLRAQEDAAWRGRQASNLANAGGLQASIGAQYGQQGQADLGAAVTARGQNDAAALGWAGQGSDAWKAGVASNLAGQGIANDVRGQEMQGGLAMQDNMLREWAAKNGYNLAQQQRSDAKEAGYMQAGASMLTSLF